jgi:hypothetical protein
LVANSNEFGTDTEVIRGRRLRSVVNLAPAKPEFLTRRNVESFDLFIGKNLSSGIADDTESRFDESIFEIVAVPPNMVLLAKSDRVLLRS